MRAVNQPNVVQITGIIMLVDPAQNRIEAASKDGFPIIVIQTSVPSFFVWPQVGEYWTFRRENYDWTLGNRVQGPHDVNPSTADIVPGTAYVHGTSIVLSSGAQVIDSTLQIPEGTDAKQGVITLVGGQKVVLNASVTANSRIQLTSQQDGGTPGFLRISARIPGESFTIQSSSTLDTSIVAYLISEPAP